MRNGFVAMKGKRYLSGSDWVICTLDHTLKMSTCAGNMSQVVFLLDSPIDEAAVRHHLQNYLDLLPVASGRVARNYFNLVPYWKIPEKAGPAINLRVYHVDDSSGEEAVLNLLEQTVNRPFQNNNEHLAFHLVQGGSRQSWFAMTFDHRLLDARGAEAFLNLFQQYWLEKGNPDVLDGIALTAPTGLTNWKKKFSAGRNVNRTFIALSRHTPETLPVPVQKNTGFRFTLLAFGKQETGRIYDAAYREAGYLMEMPYLLSAVILAMHELFKKRGVEPPVHYLIPVSLDVRSADDIREELFFNHVSYLFFQVHGEGVPERGTLIQSIKEQMYEQVKSGLPADLAEASYLTRIAPLPILGKLLHLPFKGKVASFMFSHVGKSSYGYEEIMGGKVGNLFHMPRLPISPGLGFFFNTFGGRLNLTVSSVSGMLHPEEISALEQDLREGLLPSTPQ